MKSGIARTAFLFMVRVLIGVIRVYISMGDRRGRNISQEERGEKQERRKKGCFGREKEELEE